MAGPGCPGQLGGIDVRADVYSIGALAYQLTKSGTYDNSKDTARRMRQVNLPKRLQSILTRALQQVRERRWPDAQALADALIEPKTEIDQPAANTRPTDSARDKDETLEIGLGSVRLTQPKPARCRLRNLARLAAFGLVIAVAGAIPLVMITQVPRQDSNLRSASGARRSVTVSFRIAVAGERRAS